MTEYLSLLNEIAPERRWWHFFCFEKTFKPEKLDKLTALFLSLEKKDMKVVINRLKEKRFKLIVSTDNFFFRFLPSGWKQDRKEKITLLSSAIITMQGEIGSKYDASYIYLNEPIVQSQIDAYIDHAPVKDDFKALPYRVGRSFGKDYIYWYDQASDTVKNYPISNHKDFEKFIGALDVQEHFDSAPYEDGTRKVQFVPDIQKKVNSLNNEIGIDTSTIYYDFKGSILYHDDDWYIIDPVLKNVSLPHQISNILVNRLLNVLHLVNGYSKWLKNLEKIFGPYSIHSAPSGLPLNELSFYVRPMDSRKLLVEYFFVERDNLTNELKWSSKNLSIEEAFEAIETRLSDFVKEADKDEKLYHHSIKLIDGILTLEYNLPSPTGLINTKKKLLLNSIPQKQLESQISLPYPLKKDIIEWKKSITAFESYVAEEGLAHHPAIEGQVYVNINYPSGHSEEPDQLPEINLIWKDHNLKTHLRNVKSLKIDDLKKEIENVKLICWLNKFADQLANESITAVVDEANRKLRISSKQLNQANATKDFEINSNNESQKILFKQNVHAFIKGIKNQVERERKKVLKDFKSYIDNPMPSFENAGIRLEVNKNGCTVYYWLITAETPFQIEINNFDYETLDKKIKDIEAKQKLTVAICKEFDPTGGVIFEESPTITPRVIKKELDNYKRDYLYFTTNNHGSSYTMHYLHKPAGILTTYDIHSIDSIKTVSQKFALDKLFICKFKVSSQNVLKSISQFVDVQLPPPVPGVDLMKVKTWFSSIDFTDSTSPNYIKLSNLGKKIDVNDLNEKLDQFYEHIDKKTKIGGFASEEQDKNIQSLTALLSNIITLIDNEPDLNQRLLQVSQVVLAIHYCGTKWMMALTDQYALLKGILNGANIEEYPFEQVMLSKADVLKVKTIEGMAGEEYIPENLSEEDFLKAVGLQQEHNKKSYLSTLTAKGYKIPLSDAANYTDTYGGYEELSNYKNKKEIEAGFIKAMNSAKFVNEYHSWLNEDLKVTQKQNILSYCLKDRIFDYLNQLLDKNNEKTSLWAQEDHDQLVSELMSKKKACEELKAAAILKADEQTKTAETAKQIVTESRQELIATSSAKFLKILQNNPWSARDLMKFMDEYCILLSGNLYKDEWVNEGIARLTKLAGEKPFDNELLNHALSTYLSSLNTIFSKPDDEYLSEYKIAQLAAVQNNYLGNIKAAFEEIAEKMGLYVLDEDTGAVVSISEKGTAAMLFGLQMFEPVGA